MNEKQLQRLADLLDSGDTDEARHLIAEALVKCEGADLEAAAFESAAHGYDFDNDHKVDPYTRESEYDFDPGVSYNDAGEPRGYM